MCTYLSYSGGCLFALLMGSFEILLLATTRMEHGDVMLGEIGQMEKDKCRRILIKKNKHKTMQKYTHGCRSQMGVTGGNGAREGKWVGKGVLCRGGWKWDFRWRHTSVDPQLSDYDAVR